jgi:hypothetical protein
MKNQIALDRDKLLKEMTPAAQELAQTVAKTLSQGARGVVAMHYEIGLQLKIAGNAEAKYGTNAIEQIANYLGVPEGSAMLHDLVEITKAFEKDYVRAETEKPLSNGNYMTLMHWRMLAKIKDLNETKRDALVAKIHSESISAKDLALHIRSGGETRHSRQGGRTPVTPSNPMIGLQKFYTLAHSLENWQGTAEKGIFDVLDEISPDLVTDKLVAKTEETLGELDRTIKASQAMQTRLKTNLARLKKVKPEAAKTGKATKGAKGDADEEYDEGAAGAKPKGKKVKGKKVKGKKVKGKKPIAAA